MKSITFSLCAGFLLALASCTSSDSPQGMADKAIDAADAAVETQNSDLLGELPTIAARNLAARDSLKKISQAIMNDQKESGTENLTRISENAESAKQIIDEHYTDLFNDKAEDYIGLTVKCGQDERVFSAASAKIIGFKGATEATVEYTLTAAQPLGRHLRMMFVNASNQLIMPYSLLCKPCEAGTTFTGTTNVPVTALGKTSTILFGL